MLVLDKDNYAAEVLESEGIVVVDWWGPRCAPCLALMPRMEALSERYQGRVKFGKVNSAENRRLAIEHRVMGLPTIIFYRNGEVVASLHGDDARADAVDAEVLSLLQESAAD